jgi:hypothetical protein
MANQKRKRGRPTNASRQDEDASQTQLTLKPNGTIAHPPQEGAQDDVEEEMRPKKRGRKAKQVVSPRPAPDVHDQEEPPKKRRGRSAFSQRPQREDASEISEPTIKRVKQKKHGRRVAVPQKAPGGEDQDLDAVTQHPPPKKRGRPSFSQSQEEPQNTHSAAPSQIRRRGRPPRQSEQAAAKGTREAAAEEADDENEADSSSLKRNTRGRRKSKDKDQTSPVLAKRPATTTHTGSAEGTKAPRGRSKKSGKPSLQEKAKASDDQREIANDPTPGKRGPRKRGPATVDVDSPKVVPSKPGRKKRGRSSLGSTAESAEESRPRRQRKNKEPVDQQEKTESAREEQSLAEGDQPKSDKITSKRGKRRRTSQEDNESRASSPEPPPYRFMTARTRKISRQAIQENWSPLDTISVDSVMDLLHTASRPVLLRINNLTKHAQAAAALNTISNRLRSKLTRGLPFPSATTSQKREDEFEYERTVDGIQSLESQLDPLLHSVSLLEKEKERAEKELDKEYKLLNSISANARSESRARRDQLRKVHALVPDFKHDDNTHEVRMLELQAPVAGRGNVFMNPEDEELQGLAEQLGNHMESMRSNLSQIEGILPAIADSRATLRLALLPHLDEKAFEQVLLG